MALKYRQIPGASLNASSDVFPCVNALRILFCLALYPHAFVVSSSCAVNGGSPLIVSIQYSWSDKGVVTSWVVVMPHSPNELVNKTCMHSLYLSGELQNFIYGATQSFFCVYVLLSHICIILTPTFTFIHLADAFTNEEYKQAINLGGNEHEKCL